MKRSIQLLPTLVGFALAAGSQVYSQNLVTNPGFEDPIGSEWTWTFDSGANPAIADRFANATNHTGDYAYRLAYGDDVGSSYIVQTISNLTADATYTIKGWVLLYFRADRNWAYIEAQGGGPSVSAPAQGDNPMLSNTLGIWTNIVLTQTARVDGTLDVLLRLDHYSATVNGKDNGCYFDDIEVTEGAPAVPLEITSISGAGTTSVTVTWTNAVAGTNYVLQYNTNLATTDWTSLSPVQAGGSTASQTDNPPSGDPQRFYRVLVQ